MNVPLPVFVAIPLVTAFVLPLFGKKGKGGAASLNPTDSIEIWRLLGSMELLRVPLKVQLGDMILDLLPKRKLAKIQPSLVWTLGRLGQRVPIYGPLNTVVPRDKAAACGACCKGHRPPARQQ